MAPRIGLASIQREMLQELVVQAENVNQMNKKNQNNIPLEYFLLNHQSLSLFFGLQRDHPGMKNRLLQERS